ncbi:MAG: hypothetical protein AAF125_10480 [Chloroflexota bacterium]
MTQDGVVVVDENSNLTEIQFNGNERGIDSNVSYIIGGAVSPAIRATNLRLTSLCSPDPNTVRIWRVRNTNTNPVDFTWDVVGTDQTGSGTVPGGSADNPGEVTFETVAVDGPNTTRIFVNGEQQDVKASTPDACTVSGPQIGQLILVDATTDNDLFALTDGMTVDLATLGVSELSVRAAANDLTESVQFDFNGQVAFQTENSDPYVLFGDPSGGGDIDGERLLSGTYTVTATPYSADDAQGEAGDPVSVSFNITGAEPAIAQLVLVDPSTNTDVMPITDGMTVDLVALGLTEIAIRADVNDLTESVQFDFDGQAAFRTENVEPYLLFGDQSDDDVAIDGRLLASGSYTVTATPFSENSASGVGGVPTSVTFDIINVAPTVESFTLVDSTTNADLMPLTDGMTVDLVALGVSEVSIRANANAITESVQFDFDDETAFRTENIVPYMLFGDQSEGAVINGRTLTTGSYTVTATPYSENSAEGVVGVSNSITFDLINVGPTVDSLILVDATTNADLMPLVDGMTVDLAALGVTEVSVRAEANALTESVRFGFDGQETFRIENIVPYMLFGDQSGGTVINGEALASGTYIIDATPYSENSASGVEGSIVSVTIVIQ